MLEKFLELAASQLGYKEDSGNITKYSSYFDNDAWQWFNTKKQGADWCAIFICWLFCQLIGPDRARTFLGCPAPKDNCAAGVKFLWQYLGKRGWKVNKKEGQPGDIIFLNTSKSTNGHVGLIQKIEDGKYITIEGNKSNKVASGSYKIGSSTVYGICRPAWSEIDNVASPAPSKPAQSSSGYTAAEIAVAKDVIKGKYGNGQARRLNLQKAGYDYSRIQGLVNKILRGEIK